MNMHMAETGPSNCQGSSLGSLASPEAPQEASVQASGFFEIAPSRPSLLKSGSELSVWCSVESNERQTPTFGPRTLGGGDLRALRGGSPSGGGQHAERQI